MGHLTHTATLMSMADRISIREVVEGLLKTKHRHFSYHQPLPLSRIQHPLEGGIRIPFREGGKSVFRQFKSVVLSPPSRTFFKFRCLHSFLLRSLYLHHSHCPLPTLTGLVSSAVSGRTGNSFRSAEIVNSGSWTIAEGPNPTNREASLPGIIRPSKLRVSPN